MSLYSKARFAYVAPSVTTSVSHGVWTKEIKLRNTPSLDGATSRHVIERLDGEVTSVTHQVIKDGEVIHQHQTHHGKSGTDRQFPDQRVEYPSIPGGGQL